MVSLVLFQFNRVESVYLDPYVVSGELPVSETVGRTFKVDFALVAEVSRSHFLRRRALIPHSRTIIENRFKSI